jgi:hypothetical protein
MYQAVHPIADHFEKGKVEKEDCHRIPNEHAAWTYASEGRNARRGVF